MTEGDVVLAQLQQADRSSKIRPAVFLKRMPPFGDFLVCGISSKLQQCVLGFDEIMGAEEADFLSSGLKARSVIRLGYLSVLPASSFVGAIGSISAERHRRLVERLATYIASRSD